MTNLVGVLFIVGLLTLGLGIYLTLRARELMRRAEAMSDSARATIARAWALREQTPYPEEVQ